MSQRGRDRYLTCNQVHYRSFVSFQVSALTSQVKSSRGTCGSSMANEYKWDRANAVPDKVNNGKYERNGAELFEKGSNHE